MKAAKAAGFNKTGMICLLVEGDDRAGLAAEIAGAVGEAGVNLRGLTGFALDGDCRFYLSLDSDKDAAAAAKVIKKL